MITRENIASHEFIGLQTEIVDSKNQNLIGVHGQVIDETKFMFVLNTEKGIKNFPKDICHWKFSFGDQEAELDGSKLTKRPFERKGVKA